MPSRYSQYLTRCVSCGNSTSKQHANAHDGLCAPCANPEKRIPTREERILEHGYQAYAREEGHYDND